MRSRRFKYQVRVATALMAATVLVLPLAGASAHAASRADGAARLTTQPTSTHRHLVGTWFETWFNRTTSRVWLRGAPSRSGHGLVGDVTGDGTDDAVLVRGGRWYLARSTGSSFVRYHRVLVGLGTRSSHDFLADVDADGTADAVSLTEGHWQVARSNGNRFGYPTTWATGAPAAGSVFVADVTGDGRADVVQRDRAGRWTVRPSTGTRFGPAQAWGRTDGGTALVGDVTGDGRADVVTVSPHGTWTVAPSTGSSFGPAATWLTDFGGDGSTPMLGDISVGAGAPDGAADAVVATDGVWSVATSNRATAFTSAHELAPYRAGFGGNAPVNDPFGAGDDQLFVANTYGGGDPTGSLIAFDPGDGSWQVTGANDYYYKQKNRWEAWHCPYLPKSAPGIFAQYDSADPAVIGYQLHQLAAAGIDFLIFDETNGLHVDDDSILGPNLAFVHELARWNRTHSHKIRYAISVGVVNYTHDITDIEREAAEVAATFVDDPAIGTAANYQSIEGKPLLVLYTDRATRDRWLDSDIDKSATDQFHVGYAEGPLYRGYYGWYNPLSGPVPDADVMYVTPRRADPDGELFGRSLTYYRQSWQAVLRADPTIVVVGGFNDYQENSWWAPTDTSRLPPDMQRYTAPGDVDPYAAYDMTKRFIRAFTR